MAICLGLDTGGTFTDAVILDDAISDPAAAILASAKALTTRPDPAPGLGAAIDNVLAALGGPDPGGRIALVGLSTTLATNALVEGRGDPAALVAIGFGADDLLRAGLSEALGRDPLISLDGGHDHAGGEQAPLDRAGLQQALAALPRGIRAIAVAARFATRNPAHELAARAVIREATGLPVTCSHELSAALNGPKRALTALLNARLTGLIAQLVDACAAHLATRGIAAPLMVVRGDGALIPSALVRERPIETILSGPAASVAGARWLTGAESALVSDIGGTTTDVCLLRAGRPALDPLGAQVGGFRTMVRAVAMRTTGLGGDSEVHVEPGLGGALRLGPRRVMPIALAARRYPELVHKLLDTALAHPAASEGAARLVLPLGPPPAGLPAREAELAARLAAGPLSFAALIRQRIEAPALDRLVARGHAILSDVTPSDAAHVLGRQSGWDLAAAEKALALMARRRRGDGTRLATEAAGMAEAVLAALAAQTVDFVMECALAEDGRDLGGTAAALARHPTLRAALDRGPGLVALSARLGVPLIGLGASAGCHYGPVAARLGCELIVPAAAGVANAVGAVVGQVELRAEGVVTCPGPGLFLVHLPDTVVRFAELALARDRLAEGLTAAVQAQATRAGLEAPVLTLAEDLVAAEVEGQRVPVELRMSVTASGRPQLA